MALSGRAPGFVAATTQFSMLRLTREVSFTATSSNEARRRDWANIALRSVSGVQVDLQVIPILRRGETCCNAAAKSMSTSIGPMILTVDTHDAQLRRSST